MRCFINACHRAVAVPTQMNRIPVITVMVLLVSGALLTGCSQPAEPVTPRTATVLPAPQALPEFTLLDTTGAEQTRAFFEGDWDLLFFGFTNCPDICPMTLATLTSAVNELERVAPGAVPRIVLVAVDPREDTPEKLGAYIANFSERTRGLTGNDAALRELTEPLGVYFREVAVGDGYTVDHSAAVLLINPDGEFHALFSGPHKAENFVHDLPLILGAS